MLGLASCAMVYRLFCISFISMSCILANALGRSLTNGPQGQSCEITVKVAHEFPKKKHAPISFYIFRLSFLPIFLEPTCFNYTTEVAVGVEKNYLCIGISMNFVLHGFFGHFNMWVTLCLSILCCLCFSLIFGGRMQMKSFVVCPCSTP
jgi:hypothetical protein